MSVVDDILAHTGVKGMRWGIRRKATVDAREVIVSNVQRRRSSEVTIKESRKKLKTVGGKGLPAHPDAIRARTIGQKGKGSGLKTLSDAELRVYANRLNMEQNVRRLNFNEAHPAKKFALSVLGKSGKQATDEAAKSATAYAGKKAAARAAKLAAMAAA